MDKFINNDLCDGIHPIGTENDAICPVSDFNYCAHLNLRWPAAQGGSKGACCNAAPPLTRRRTNAAL
jgi:hypothetical protein